MKRLVIGLVAVLVVALALIPLALLSPPSPGRATPISFYVLPGTSLRGVASQLAEKGLIRTPRAFVLLARARNQDRGIEAGAYRAAPSEWAWDILNRLARGDVLDTLVTVPEGLWLPEIAALVGPLVAGGADSFAAVARDSLFLAGLGVGAPTAEGYLYPETYRVSPGGPARLFVERMVGAFQKTWMERLAARAETTGVDRHTAVTLAAIVEAEAQRPEERARIAAVYWNRLRRGMPLQADPTVAYAVGKRLPRVLFEDLEYPSPYNTYLVTGLPPGPIGNPGFASLHAVLWPLENCEDLYFVAAGDGSHWFAPDFQGHLRNRRRIEREREEHP